MKIDESVPRLPISPERVSIVATKLRYSVLVASGRVTSRCVATTPVGLLVGDLGFVSLRVGSIFHGLDPTIGKKDEVLARCYIAISLFLVTEIQTSLVVLDVVFKLVFGWCLKHDFKTKCRTSAIKS